MSKFRVIPIVLTDGLTVVKGDGFNNWRSVGSTQTSARLFGMRDVDELVLIDTRARFRNETIRRETIEEFADALSVPLTVGGGVQTISDIENYLKWGAEKVLIGTSAMLDPDLIALAASRFGSQSIMVSIDVVQLNPDLLAVKSGKEILDSDLVRMAEKLSENGVGEILLQSVNDDGKMCGINFMALEKILPNVQVPIIVSGGAKNPEDFYAGYLKGASGVAAGALFQFTPTTPATVRDFLAERGVPIRVS